MYVPGVQATQAEGPAICLKVPNGQGLQTAFSAVPMVDPEYPAEQRLHPGDAGPSFVVPVGHNKHPSDPSSPAYSPCGQLEQLVAPGSIAYFPNGHNVGLADALDPAYEPAGTFIQVVEPATEKLPEGQAVHAEAAKIAPGAPIWPIYPPAHILHVDESTLLVVPEGQTPQSVPPAFETAPTAQGKHWVEPVLDV